jgi:transcriptional regulator with XRE-family HTH domain
MTRKKDSTQEKSKLASYLEDAFRRSSYRSMRALSLGAGLSPIGVSTILAGTAWPQPETLRKLARVLDVDQAVLLRLGGYLTDEESPTPSSVPEMDEIVAQVKTLPRPHQRVFWRHARDLLRLIEALPEDKIGTA